MDKILTERDLATVFFSYSHADEALRDQLEKQLAMLKRQGVIETWHDRRIGAGDELDPSISAHVESDDIILLLVSPDFLASDYCYDREMRRAMERHDAKQAIVIPIILRPCDWHGARFGKLMATPTDGKPVTQWSDRDEALLNVAHAIRAAAGKVSIKAEPIVSRSPPVASAATEFFSQPERPRSSNLRLAKTFTDRDRDRFKIESFEYISNYFQNSLSELGERNSGIAGDFRRIDGNRFTASIYRDGKAIARCTVFTGGGSFIGKGIAYLNGESTTTDSYNENLSVDADEQALFLRPHGMSMRGQIEGKLSQEGAAEFYWNILIEPLQQRYQ